MFVLLLSFTKCDLGCDLCKTGVSTLIETIEQGVSDETIKNELAKACSTMPSSYQEVCIKFQDHIDNILQKIHEGTETPEQICTDETFCTNNMRSIDSPRRLRQISKFKKILSQKLRNTRTNLY